MILGALFALAKRIRGVPGPPLEGVVEGALVGIAHEESNLRDLQSPLGKQV